MEYEPVNKVNMNVEKNFKEYADSFYSIRTANGDKQAKRYLEIILNDIALQIDDPTRRHEFLWKYSKESLEELHGKLLSFTEREIK